MGTSTETPKLVAAAVAAGLVMTTAAAHASGQVRCDRLEFEVALAPDEPADYQVVGWLCAEPPLAGKTVQVLVHGATYDHHLWDFPYQPENYSYVRAANEAGYATLNLDRLGHGQSSRVPGDDLDLAAGAYAIHQVIEDVRAGEHVARGLGRVQPERILLAGASLGANISWLTAARHGGIDALLIAGSAHTFGIGMDRVLRITPPVELDPQLGDEDFPAGYFTTVPGTRGAAYYELAFADPQVVVFDEALKQTITSGEMESIPESLTVASEIDVPTLITMGDHDDIFCEQPTCSETGSLDDELDFYSDDACPELLIVPEAGHNLNMHDGAPTYFEQVTEWADRFVGPDKHSPPTESCP